MFTHLLAFAHGLVHKGLWVLVGSPEPLSLPLPMFSQEEICLCSPLCLIQLSLRKAVLGVTQEWTRRK